MRKTIIITGAGTGIGAATAVELDQTGAYDLILMGRTPSTLDRTLAALSATGKHQIAVCDINDKSAFHQALAQCKVEKREVVGLFANAGAGGANFYGKDDQWDHIIQTNLTGTYISIMETLPYLRKAKGFKHIVMTSSVVARFGVADLSAYCTSKAGLLGLTKSLAVQLAPDKILVNAICPGWTETEMSKESIQRMADKDGITYQTSYDQQMAFVPTGKMSQPDEMGRLVRFLMSNEQTSITGQGIDINNGTFMI